MAISLTVLKINDVIKTKPRSSLSRTIRGEGEADEREKCHGMGAENGLFIDEGYNSDFLMYIFMGGTPI